MSTEFPEQYTQEQFVMDLERTIQEAKTMGDTHFVNFDFSEPVVDSESKKVFKKFIDQNLTPADVQNYAKYLLQLPKVAENQKEILEFVTYEAQRGEPNKVAMEVENRLAAFQEEFDRIVKESQVRGEKHFSLGFNSSNLGIPDLELYEKYLVNDVTEEELTERSLTGHGFVHKEFAEYLKFLRSQGLRRT